MWALRTNATLIMKYNLQVYIYGFVFLNKLANMWKKLAVYSCIVCVLQNFFYSCFWYSMQQKLCVFQCGYIGPNFIFDSFSDIYTHTHTHRVSQEERSVFWEVIVSVTLNKQLFNEQVSYSNGFRGTAIWLYSVLAWPPSIVIPSHRAVPLSEAIATQQPHVSAYTGVYQIRCTAYKVAPDDGLIKLETCRASNRK